MSQRDNCARECFTIRKGLAKFRDTDVLEHLRFPVWATAISPIRPEKRAHGAVNVPVACDGVIVNPGDLIIADGDGVICIPRAEADAAIAGAQARMAREDALAEAIQGGAHPWEFGKMTLVAVEASLDHDGYAVTVCVGTEDPIAVERLASSMRSIVGATLVRVGRDLDIGHVVG